MATHYSPRLKRFTVFKKGEQNLTEKDQQTLESNQKILSFLGKHIGSE